MATCSCPGCDQPGTNLCSACKATPYCGPICQTADWAHHKEECPGHLRKTGMAHLQKAEGFERANNNVQVLRYADLALTKLKLLKDRPLEAIDRALSFKTSSLQFLGRHREAMENAKERYTMWAMTNIRNPLTMLAAFDLIECCLHMNEFVDAELYARTAYDIINDKTDNVIPLNKQKELLSKASYFLARTTMALAQTGGIAPGAMQASGVEAIALARKSIEIDTQLHGPHSCEVAEDLGVLATVLEVFNDADDDEILRLLERTRAIFIRQQGSMSPNVAASEENLGATYGNRATRAQEANDRDRAVTDLRLALSHYREAARIFGAIQHVDRANAVLRTAARMEERLRFFG